MKKTNTTVWQQRREQCPDQFAAWTNDMASAITGYRFTAVDCLRPGPWEIDWERREVYLPVFVHMTVCLVTALSVVRLLTVGVFDHECDRCGRRRAVRVVETLCSSCDEAEALRR